MPVITPPHLNAWQPGRQGKGFVLGDGRVFTWTVNGIDGYPSHDEAVTTLDGQSYDYNHPFYISPEGEIAFYHFITGEPGNVARLVVSADPRLHHQQQDAMDVFESGQWSFTAATRIPPIADYEAVNLLHPKSAEQAWSLVNSGWTPGKAGKGLVNAGQLYTWNVTNDDGWPHHDHVCDLLEAAGVEVDPNVYNQIIVYIDEDGEFDCLDEALEEGISQQDPRLKPTKEGWGFSASTKTAEGDGGGGGGEGGGDASSGSTAPTAVTYLAHPGAWWGPWGYAHARFQKHHRKKKKKRKKKSDFWTDQRKQEFPEDFEPEIGEDPDDRPRKYTPEEIRGFVAKGYTGQGFGGHGKAIIADHGVRYDWDVQDKHGGPHHHEVEDALKIMAHDEILIDPDGTETSWGQLMEMDDLNEEAKEMGVSQAEWHFGAFEEGDEQHVLNWEEGTQGKGLLFADGSLHTWNADDYEVHHDYLYDHPELNEQGAEFLYIDRDGKVTTIWGGLSPVAEQRIKDADPRLYVDIDTGSGSPWQFGAAVE